MTDDPNDEATLVAGEVDSVPLPGRTFAGRYRIEKLLGQGAMGAVYSAQDEEVGERVALKIVICEQSSETLERFRREVRLARRVTHRNAARTYDLGEHAGQHFLTMELIEGESLQARLAREGRLSADVAREVGVQICHGLAAAHGVGVVHRDLKPANVLIEENGRVVITDFGVARGLHGDPEVTTDALAVVGTPAYMAPEQVTSSEIGPRTDLYALGIMLYEMLAGVRPFVGDTAMAIASARLTTMPDSPAVHVELEAKLEALVMSCLAMKPEDRPESAHAVARALAQAANAELPGAVSTLGGQAATVAQGDDLSATVTPLERSLAVRPFRYRGPADQEYLSEALCEELVDVLSMTRGLQVVGAGATAELAEVRDPKRVGEELGVDAIIEGTLQRAGDQVRIVARLIEVESGFQLWSDRFDGRLEDVFDLQDRVAKRVAEALRVQLEDHASAQKVPADVVELYLRARAKAREVDMSGVALGVAYDMFQDALRRVPTFAAALAQAAEAAVRRWFIPTTGKERDWGAEAKRAVEAALIGAPHLVESHTAAARYHVSCGDVAAAVGHLRNALAIAPTSAAAHEYLGFLQCEAGRSEDGVRHILHAYELDPTATGHLVVVARHYALRQQWDEYEALMTKLRATPEVAQFTVDIVDLRVAGWRGNLQRFRELRPSLRLGKPHPAEMMPALLARVILGETSPADGVEELDELCSHMASPRFRCTTRQLSCETLVVVGEIELSLGELAKAVDEGVLIDADWIDRCSALDPLRERAEFAAASKSVHDAADAIWRK
ncbi:MAG: protein kinase [Myxococcota bacterium]